MATKCLIYAPDQATLTTNSMPLGGCRIKAKTIRILFVLKTQVHFMRHILALVLCLACGAAFAQTSTVLSPLSSQEHHTGAASEPFASRVLTFAIGKEAADGFAYLPFGWHPSDSFTTDNISLNHFVSLTKNGISGTTFINSFGDRTWSLGLSRTLFLKNRIGLDYSVGLMVGYRGELAPIVPHSLRPLFESNITPYIIASPYYQITEKLEARVLYGPPNVFLFGINYLF
jgi:hypothetical protein